MESRSDECRSHVHCVVIFTIYSAFFQESQPILRNVLSSYCDVKFVLGSRLRMFLFCPRGVDFSHTGSGGIALASAHNTR